MVIADLESEMKRTPVKIANKLPRNMRFLAKFAAQFGVQLCKINLPVINREWLTVDNLIEVANYFNCDVEIGLSSYEFRTPIDGQVRRAGASYFRGNIYSRGHIRVYSSWVAPYVLVHEIGHAIADYLFPVINADHEFYSNALQCSVTGQDFKYAADYAKAWGITHENFSGCLNRFVQIYETFYFALAEINDKRGEGQ
jgi:hypothetical protein